MAGTCEDQPVVPNNTPMMEFEDNVLSSIDLKPSVLFGESSRPQAQKEEIDGSEEFSRRLKSHLLRRGDRKGQSLFQEYASSCSEKLRQSILPPGVGIKKLRIKEGSWPSPRKALGVLSPNIANSRSPHRHAAHAHSDAATHAHHLPEGGSPRTRRRNLLRQSVEGVSAGVQAELAPAPHVCCHVLLETAMRERDQAHEQLRVLKDVTDEVVQQASSAQRDEGVVQDVGELQKLLARAQAAIALERVEHAQLKSKYKLAVKKVVELSVKSKSSTDITSSQTPILAADTRRSNMSCQTEEKDDNGEGLELEEERMQWKAMLKESDERCAALCRHLEQIQADEQRLVSLLTKKVEVLTWQRNKAESQLASISPRGALARQPRGKAGSPIPPAGLTMSPRSPIMPCLPEVEGEEPTDYTTPAVQEVRGQEVRGQEVWGEDSPPNASIPLPPLPDTPPSNPAAALEQVQGCTTSSATLRYTLKGTPMQTPIQREIFAVNGELEDAKKVFTSPAPSTDGSCGTPGEGGIFHRFFSQPDFDSSFSAWIKLQAFDQLQDTVPEAVSSWMRAELPWEKKGRDEVATADGFRLFFF